MENRRALLSVVAQRQALSNPSMLAAAATHAADDASGLRAAARALDLDTLWVAAAVPGGARSATWDPRLADAEHISHWLLRSVALFCGHVVPFLCLLLLFQETCLCPTTAAMPVVRSDRRTTPVASTPCRDSLTEFRGDWTPVQNIPVVPAVTRVDGVAPRSGFESAVRTVRIAWSRHLSTQPEFTIADRPHGSPGLSTR